MLNPLWGTQFPSGQCTRGTLFTEFATLISELKALRCCKLLIFRQTLVFRHRFIIHYKVNQKSFNKKSLKSVGMTLAKVKKQDGMTLAKVKEQAGMTLAKVRHTQVSHAPH